MSIPSSIKLGQKIGKGKFAEVYEGSFVDPRTNTKYDSVAIKVIQIPSNSSSLDKQREEVKIVQSILKSETSSNKESSSSIARIYSHVEHNNTLYIIMEKCDGDGVMFQQMINRLKQEGKFDEILDLLKQNLIHLCQGLEEIHTNCIIHRDIKPANLLFIKSNNKLKFTDFGLSCVYRDCKGFAGTLNYIDPICFIDIKFKKSILYNNRIHVKCRLNQLSDIYSLGITFYYLLTGDTITRNIVPKTKEEYLEMLQYVNKTLDTYKDRSQEWTIFINCIQNMIHLFPHDRPTLSQCIDYLTTGNEDYFTSKKAKKQKSNYLTTLLHKCIYS